MGNEGVDACICLIDLQAGMAHCHAAPGMVNRSYDETDDYYGEIKMIQGR